MLWPVPNKLPEALAADGYLLSFYSNFESFAPKVEFLENILSLLRELFVKIPIPFPKKVGPEPKMLPALNKDLFSAFFKGSYFDF